MSFSKVRLELVTSEARQAERLAFLILSGSFSPIHTQHMRALEIARDVMLNLGWYVIGGFLVPSDDQYVSQKVGSDAWPLSRRLELCRVATEESPWVEVTPWAEFSCFRAAHRLQDSIESECREVLHTRPLTSVAVMGSDTALRVLRVVLRKWETSCHHSVAPSSDPTQLICCLMRPGAHGDAAMQEIIMNLGPRAEPLGIKIVVSSAGTHALLDVSSEKIRNAIKGKHWDELQDRGLLNIKVLDRLRSGDR